MTEKGSNLGTWKMIFIIAKRQVEPIYVLLLLTMTIKFAEHNIKR